MDKMVKQLESDQVKFINHGPWFMMISISIMINLVLKVLSLNQTGIFEKKLVEQSDIATNLEEKKEKLDDKRKELESRLNDTNIALKSLEDEITAQKKKIDSFESMFENIFKHHENATQGKTI